MKNETILKQLLNGQHLELSEVDRAKELLNTLQVEIDNRIGTLDPKRIKQVEFYAKEWHDYPNANTYFSSRIYVDRYNGESDLYYVEFTYGYDNQYIYESFKKLIELGIIDTNIPRPWDYFNDNGIKFVTHIETVKDEQETRDWGQL